ncbi:response regulator [Paenibacillus sacheonensis]|uniref:Circadian input-output histidine kinase CikA n=1 Tax=Paenibacillus sacheonensis TaxID=742054 RepID=A0A7X4YQI1_9BACL|nr:response regulator [Paenibacillus sacheonensis]MBM7566661.1 CheY-like chemotaxis protein/signal transduction histidine kinase/CHASE3 domain sensor protein/GAF domain-containing protein [Paenibacillus sacheonensis]NBC70643.1 response regulator [Paenibacillus sacheonensis]
MLKNVRFTIRSKIILGYLIVLVSVGVSIAVLSGRMSTMDREIDFINSHDMAVHDLANQIEARVLDMETGQRGYVITGDASYLDPYTAARTDWMENYSQLYLLVNDNPGQQANLREIKANVEKWIEIAGDPVIAAKKAGDDAQVAEFFKLDSGKKIIDTLRFELSDFLSIEKQLTDKRVNDLDAKNASFKIGLYIMLLIVTVLAVLVSIIISGTIVGSIKQVVKAIHDIATSEGKQELRRIDVRTRDEVRDLCEATNGLLEKQERTNWLQSGIAEVAVASQGSSHVSELGQAYMAKIALLLGASCGVFYVRQEDKLVRSASFAASGSPAGVDRFAIGEGIVGQSAQERRVFLLDEVPERHLRITTGLGDSAPASILVFPIEFEGRVEGVVELASLQPFTPLHVELIEQSRGNAGTALNNVKAQMEVARLLEESKTLTEELQVQTEELQQQSEELQAQSEEMFAQQEELRTSNDLMKVSEERLQRQQEELEESNLELAKRSQRLEAQMKQADAFNKQIEQQNAVLAKQATDLATASRYKSEFLANMSHELRTPLNSLLILSQMLADNKSGNLQPKQVEFANTIHSSGTDLLRLIDEILDLSKVEAGQMKIEKEAVYLADIREGMQRSYEPLAAKKGIEFRVELQRDLPESVFTDGHRLQQILKNLLSNAFKFTHQGHVTLRVHRPGGAVPNVAGGAEGIIAFSVIDSGIGIPAGKKEIIFEAFQQADGSTSRKYGGTGLGLTISRELSALIGGHIAIESEEGSGSAFTLYLPEEADEETAARPVLEETGAAAEAFLATESQGAKRKEELLAPSIEWSSPELLLPSSLEDDRDSIQNGDRVLLIIEDDIRFASILLDMARSRHFKGLVALEGDKGLALAHAYRPDGILLDIQVPVLDGWSILERLKQHSELRHIPVHVISVVDEPQKGLTMGAMAFLQKPVDKAHIEQALARVESFMSRDLKRLLIVEDDLVLRSSMVELIGHDDVLITAVSTGHEALRELEREHFDCMVLDLGLSDITGFELLDRIRRLDHLKQLPIIIYTGKDLDMREELELKKYAESIIIKNVKSQERLFDETALFLHRVKADMPEDRRQILDRLYNNEAAFDGKRLLLVEDDIRNIFALSNVLESYNMRISFAENGREALELLEKDPDFDLILMDIMMPEMDGYEAMKALRAMPQFEKMPIIALTAKAMKEDRQRCLDAGASDYISKPIDIEKLLSLLKVWLYT